MLPYNCHIIIIIVVVIIITVTVNSVVNSTSCLSLDLVKTCIEQLLYEGRSKNRL